MEKRTTSRLFLIVCFFWFSHSLLAQITHHDHSNSSVKNNSIAVVLNSSNEYIPTDLITEQAKSITGQGSFRFSWDEVLTDRKSVV